jgi:glucosamine-phosphate N-acetyltransferase
MIQALDSVGRNVGCYKNILNCSAKNEPFYVKCGYFNSGAEMSNYFEELKDDYHRG